MRDEEPLYSLAGITHLAKDQVTGVVVVGIELPAKNVIGTSGRSTRVPNDSRQEASKWGTAVREHFGPGAAIHYIRPLRRISELRGGFPNSHEQDAAAILEVALQKYLGHSPPPIKRHKATERECQRRHDRRSPGWRDRIPDEDECD